MRVIILMNFYVILLLVSWNYDDQFGEIHENRNGKFYGCSKQHKCFHEKGFFSFFFLLKVARFISYSKEQPS